MTENNVIRPLSEEEADFLITRLITAEYATLALLAYCKENGTDAKECEDFVNNFLKRSLGGGVFEEVKGFFMEGLPEEVKELNKGKSESMRETA